MKYLCTSRCEPDTISLEQTRAADHSKRWITLGVLQMLWSLFGLWCSTVFHGVWAFGD
jgi:hypothetical protein